MEIKHANPKEKTQSKEVPESLDDDDDDYDKSPRGVLEIPVSAGTDSDQSSVSSSCSINSNSTSSSDKTLFIREEENPASNWRKLIGIFKKKSARKFSTIPFVSSYDITMWNLKKKLFRLRTGVEDEDDVIDLDGIPVPKPSWRSFGYDELKNATDNFSAKNLIGKGGNAEVYKGVLSSGQVVAVKRLTKKDGEDEERTGNFLSELGIIAHINHPNAANLLGYGVDNGLHLVLEYSPHGNLHSVLHVSGSSNGLEWKIRFKVALGIAQGLEYLHHICHRRIIHRDIKASNILLTEDYEAQISDFGLAKWLPEKWINHVVHPIEGTFGYLAPEYFMHGIVDEKIDVFAYGVLLLEIITGRHAVDSHQQSLVMWAKPLLDDDNVKEITDPNLGDAYDPDEMKRCMQAASMCIQHSSSTRPHMNKVVLVLRGQEGLMELKQKSFTERAFLLDRYDLEDYTNTSYLIDLNRHMQLAME